MAKCESAEVVRNGWLRINIFQNAYGSIISELNKMHYQLMFVPNKEDFLITSDSPVIVLSNLETDSSLFPFEIVFYPLAPRFGVALSKKSLFEGCTEPIKKVSDYVDKFNRFVYCTADRFVYSNRPLTEKYIDKF